VLFARPLLAARWADLLLVQILRHLLRDQGPLHPCQQRFGLGQRQVERFRLKVAAL
jgi:hypothetical protein